MDTKELQRVALRRRRVFVPGAQKNNPAPYPGGVIPDFMLHLLSVLQKSGYRLDEGAIHALSREVGVVEDFTEVFRDVFGLDLNWTPLIRKWNVPGGYDKDKILLLKLSYMFLPELFEGAPALPCGHTIPRGLVDLSAFNGCPLCGRPFEVNTLELRGEGSRLTELSLVTEEELKDILMSLYRSKVPLGGTEREDLSILLGHFGMPGDEIPPVRENRVLVASFLFDCGETDRASSLLDSPRDILRFLWYRHSDNLLLVPPSSLARRYSVLYTHIDPVLDRKVDGMEEAVKRLKLHYGRAQCRIVASWMNSLEGTEESICEQMHPDRGMWVRFIRALRLGEYARKPGYGKLAAILDRFYREDYEVWAGEVDTALGAGDSERALDLLCSRPGTFARRLFSLMLRLDWREVTDKFRTVLPGIPVRIILSMYSTAQTYFWGGENRTVNIPGVGLRTIPYKFDGTKDPARTQQMIWAVGEIAADALRGYFGRIEGEDVPSRGSRIFIGESLFNMPVPVSDRSDGVTDLSSIPQGTVIPVLGDRIRLFLGWGEGLPAQHMDMDLSCRVVYGDGSTADCAYYNLYFDGARHSGDIREIPDKVGTAEYVELDLGVLASAGARWAFFTSNAYSLGALEPNMKFGWMDSANPMTVSPEGVAYDPSCVRQLARIPASRAAKGLLFGALDILRREIVWMDVPFEGQIAKQLDLTTVQIYLLRLRNKLSVGRMLEVMAESRDIRVVDRAEDADVVYDGDWAGDPSRVLALLSH